MPICNKKSNRLSEGSRAINQLTLLLLYRKYDANNGLILEYTLVKNYVISRKSVQRHPLNLTIKNLTLSIYKDHQGASFFIYGDYHECPTGVLESMGFLKGGIFSVILTLDSWSLESFLIDFFGKSGYFSSFNLEDSLSEIFGSFNLESSERNGIRLGVHIFHLRPTVAI
ncbi:unnamed protein product [Rhizophagus irregularis]|nr:unnamed protein product [Rhizophagus irregularis]